MKVFSFLFILTQSQRHKVTVTGLLLQIKSYNLGSLEHISMYIYSFYNLLRDYIWWCADCRLYVWTSSSFKISIQWRIHDFKRIDAQYVRNVHLRKLSPSCVCCVGGGGDRGDVSERDWAWLSGQLKEEAARPGRRLCNRGADAAGGDMWRGCRVAPSHKTRFKVSPARLIQCYSDITTWQEPVSSSIVLGCGSIGPRGDAGSDCVIPSWHMAMRRRTRPLPSCKHHQLCAKSAQKLLKNAFLRNVFSSCARLYRCTRPLMATPLPTREENQVRTMFNVVVNELWLKEVRLHPAVAWTGTEEAANTFTWRGLLSSYSTNHMYYGCCCWKTLLADFRLGFVLQMFLRGWTLTQTTHPPPTTNRAEPGFKYSSS